MNTEIETKRLKLLPGSNERDSKPFLKMLREDGDFQVFCGIEFSEKNLLRFHSYFEKNSYEKYLYSIFPKDSIGKFIGYVGFHRESGGDYEIEFYIGRNYRRNGYCEEACKAVMKQILGEGLAIDSNHRISVDKLYATTLAENVATIELLKKLGFRSEKDEINLMMLGFVDEEDDTHIYFNKIVKMIVRKENMLEPYQYLIEQLNVKQYDAVGSL